MTATEFKAWLEGYMLDRANPDPHIITAKAAQIQSAMLLPTFPGTGLGPVRMVPEVPRTSDYPFTPYTTC